MQRCHDRPLRCWSALFALLLAGCGGDDAHDSTPTQGRALGSTPPTAAQLSTQPEPAERTRALHETGSTRELFARNLEFPQILKLQRAAGKAYDVEATGRSDGLGAAKNPKHDLAALALRRRN